MAINWFKRKDKTSGPGGDDSQPEVAGEGQTASGLDAQAPTPPKATGDPGIAPAVEQAQSHDDAVAATKGKGLFSRLKNGLSKTRDILTTDIDKLFSGKGRIDEAMLEELEELLITSDIGVPTAMGLMQTITRQAGKIKDPGALKALLRQEILALMDDAKPAPPAQARTKPHVVMVVGVNGVGKTTTIGKLAALAGAQGQSVLIAAADTFRAAAVEQLSIWAQRSGAEIVKHKENSDPAAVAYDSIEAALAREIDTVFVDTAGRLHTKVNLMEELKKIKRTLAKKIPAAPHETLLVLDATTGQNALSQARLFHDAIEITGLVLTKLDGTAKGGIVISICQSLNIPLYYIGVGESIEDLQPFDPERFAGALF
jgi:fused signal recognition particle receptor